MQFLADENFPAAAVSAIRAAGLDVSWVRSDTPGAPDEVVLGRALRESRVLLTFDLDFGELVMHHGAAASCGVVLFRLAGRALKVGNDVAATLQSRSDWPGHFSVVEPGRVRMRPLNPHQ